MALTGMQEAFAIKYVECDNATEAYKHAYSTKNMKDSTIHEEAYKIKTRPHIALRINDLRAEINAIPVNNIIINREFVTKEVLETLERAKQKGDDLVVLKGLDMLAKMYDLNEDKQNDRTVTDAHKSAIFENLLLRLTDVTPEE